MQLQLAYSLVLGHVDLNVDTFLAIQMLESRIQTIAVAATSTTTVVHIIHTMQEALFTLSLSVPKCYFLPAAA